MRSVYRVAPGPSGSKRCTWIQWENGPSTCSSTNLATLARSLGATATQRNRAGPTRTLTAVRPPRDASRALEHVDPLPRRGETLERARALVPGEGLFGRDGQRAAALDDFEWRRHRRRSSPRFPPCPAHHLAILLASLAIQACDRRTGSAAAQSTACVVERIVDGDTFYLPRRAEGAPHRDRCPELAQGESGRQARAALRRLLPPGASVRLERDVAPRDRYGRELAHVWSGSRLVNEALVREGWAVLYTVPPEREVCRATGAGAKAGPSGRRGPVGKRRVRVCAVGVSTRGVPLTQGTRGAPARRTSSRSVMLSMVSRPTSRPVESTTGRAGSPLARSRSSASSKSQRRRHQRRLSRHHLADGGVLRPAGSAPDEVVAGQNSLDPPEVVHHRELALLAREEQLDRMCQRRVDREWSGSRSPSSGPRCSPAPAARVSTAAASAPAPRKTKSADQEQDRHPWR